MQCYANPHVYVCLCADKCIQDYETEGDSEDDAFPPNPLQSAAIMLKVMELAKSRSHRKPRKSAPSLTTPPPAQRKKKRGGTSNGGVGEDDDGESVTDSLDSGQPEAETVTESGDTRNEGEQDGMEGEDDESGREDVTDQDSAAAAEVQKPACVRARVLVWACGHALTYLSTSMHVTSSWERFPQMAGIMRAMSAPADSPVKALSAPLVWHIIIVP